MSWRVTCTPKRICRWWSGNSDIPISKGKSYWMWQEAAQIASSVMHRRTECIELSPGPRGARSCPCSWQRSCVSRAEENVSINCAISQLQVFMWLHWRPRLQRSSRTCDADCPPPSSVPRHDRPSQKRWQVNCLCVPFACDERVSRVTGCM